MHLDSEAWFPSPYFPQKLYSKNLPRCDPVVPAEPLRLNLKSG